MALTTWDSSNYLRRTAVIYDTLPFFFSIWAYVPTANGFGTTWSLMGEVTSGGDRAGYLYVTNIATAGRVAAQSTPADNSAFSSAAASLDTWFHISGKFISTTSRGVLLNGANGGTNSGSAAPSTMADLYIGFMTSVGGFAPAGGIAEVSIWGGSMTGANMDSLAAKLFNGGAAGAGGNPINIRNEVGQPWSSQLKAYWPLLTVSDLSDASGNGHTLTHVGGSLTTFGTHPTIEAVSSGITLVNTERGIRGLNRGLMRGLK